MIYTARAAFGLPASFLFAKGVAPKRGGSLFLKNFEKISVLGGRILDFMSFNK